MADDEPAGGRRSQAVASVERAADVLIHLAQPEASSLGVTDIAKDLGLSKAVVHRILVSLRSRGLIAVDESSRRYSLGPMALALGLSSINRLDVRKAAGPVLAALAKATGETATLSVRTGNTRVYLDQATPDREVIMSVSIGVPFPLHAGASSKAFLAFLPEDEINDYLSGSLAKLTPGTVTNVSVLRRELRQIRDRGWADSAEERQSGAAAVAAPVFDSANAPVAVISVGGPVGRFAEVKDDCVTKVVAAARQLSTQLGCRDMS
jgi:IclR family acetate operon transcriptional repressor